MYCSQCGNKLPDNSNFCSKCGSPISMKKELIYNESNDIYSHSVGKIVKEQINFKTLIKNKNALKIICVSVAIIVLLTIVICSIHNKQMEVQTLEAIENHIENEEYEYAFDKINSGYLSDSDVGKYKEIVIPHMQETFEDVRKSKKDNLSLIVDGTEYYFYDGESLANSYHKIYTYIYTWENDDRRILYEVPEGNWDITENHYISADYYLNPKWCMYANDCLFFVEKSVVGDFSSSSEFYRLKYLDLSTGESGEISKGSDDDFNGMYKLEDGSIFVNFGDDDIRYNPYTKSRKIGKNIVSNEELNNAVYKN